MQPSQENTVSWLLRGRTCVFHICIPPKSLEPTAAERLTGSLCARCHPGAVHPEMDEGCSQTQAAFAYHTLCRSVPLASPCHSLPLAWTGTELSVGRHTHSPLGPDQPAAGRLWGCSFLWSFLCTHQQFIWIPRIALFCRTICELAGPAHISLLLFWKTERKKNPTNHIESVQCKGFKYQHYVWIDRNTISNKSFGCLWTLALFFLLYF